MYDNTQKRLNAAMLCIAHLSEYWAGARWRRDRIGRSSTWFCCSWWWWWGWWSHVLHGLRYVPRCNCFLLLTWCRVLNSFLLLQRKHKAKASGDLNSSEMHAVAVKITEQKAQLLLW